VATALAPDLSGKAHERREFILLAAEGVFLRKGFEGATMQDVAAAAGMSPGNIYRYFPAKASIIAGLVERDRADMNEKFAQIVAQPIKLTAFEAIARTYFAEDACPRSPLTLEIWASASRNPEIQAVCEGIEKAVGENILALLRSARENGEIAPEVDLENIRDLILILADGVMRHAGAFPAGDISRPLDLMFATIHAATSGRISFQQKQGETA
jgi:TetR/AcrR family transcriptional regulator, repressor for uid operon